MKEDFLHYVWQFKKFRFNDAKTAAGIPLIINEVGFPNAHAGPDFFNSQIKIGDQLWAGNVEIHINSSDWYAHAHETDPKYDNVILHVVWNHDADVYRRDNSIVPVLELKDRTDRAAFDRYEELISRSSEKWINCEKDFPGVDAFRLQSWLERIYFERLEEKYEVVNRLLIQSSNNWEEVFFKMLSKNFGLNLNGEAFFNTAASIPFSLVLKLQDQFKLEALFFGQAGMLEDLIEEPYYKKLQEEYLFMKTKYGLSNAGRIPVQYFRLRPDNFPSIRIAQLAALFARHKKVFAIVMEAGTVKEVYDLLEVQVSSFWETHYTFKKSHPFKKKALSKKFIDLLVINTLAPVKFAYSRHRGVDANDQILELMASIKREKNQIVERFNKLRPHSFIDALQSQALLQLKKNYCDKNRCLKCHVGTNLLQREPQINTFGVCKDL